MRIFTLLFALLLTAPSVFAQHELSVFTATGRGGVATTFATDYQAIGINPANLGWGTGIEGKKGAFTFSEGAYSLHSQALTKPELRNAIRNSDSEFTLEEKQFAANNFANTNLAINLDMTSLGFAYMNEKVGGFAISIRDRVQWFSRFNQTVSEIMFMGKHAPYFDQKLDANGMVLPEDSAQIAALVSNALASSPQLISTISEGSVINLTWWREYNFSYGRHIIKTEDLEIHAGAGIKYVAGQGIMEVETTNGEFTAYTAMTPFLDVDFGSAATANPSSIEQSGILPKAVGRGWGYDLGANVILFKRFKFGAAITDVGSITWDGNVYEAKDDTLFELDTDGLNSYNVFSQIGDVAGDDGLFSWEGAVSRKVSLPTTIRFGGSVEIVEDKFEVGVDAVIPGNDVAGGRDKGLFALGGEFSPIKSIRLSAGVSTGGNYGTQFPVGITFRSGTGTWEGGLASRDAVTFFTEDNPTISLAFGFARFRF